MTHLYMKSTVLFLITLFFAGTAFSQQISGISPNNGNAGQTLNVTITGVNTSFTQATNTVRFYFTGATATATYPNTFFVQNDYTLFANLTIPQNAIPGWHSFSVANFIDGYMLMPNAFKVNEPINVEEIAADEEFEVFPNPFSDNLTLTLANTTEERAVLKIFSSDGQLVDRRTILLTNGRNDIPMTTNLKQGAFWLVLERADGSRVTRKIVKQ